MLTQHRINLNVLLGKGGFMTYVTPMAGETGGREGPSPQGPINSISWVGPRGMQYITKMALFTSLGLHFFFSNCNNCIGGFGPFETLGDPFPGGPEGLVPSTSGIISPVLDPTLIRSCPPPPPASK